MTFLGLEARTDLPKVSYPTALDFFVFLSFAFIFATILQFAVVHYFTKYGSGECYFNFYEDSSTDSDGDDDEFQQSTSHFSSLSQVDSVDMFGVIPLSRLELDLSDDKSSTTAAKSFRRFMAEYFFCFAFSRKPRDDDDIVSETVESLQIDHQMSPEMKSSQQHNTQCRRHSNQRTKPPKGMNRNFNSVSKIDKFSRVAFPLLFFVINILYWIFYLSRSQRK
jgi:gamma-aminobutyric acid receptor subunit alpha